MEQIIKSLLENDLYKFSMGQAIYHQISDYKTTWSFKCRNEDVVFTKEIVNEIRRQIRLYCNLRFSEDELAYLNSIRWIKGSYVDFLRLWNYGNPAMMIFRSSWMKRDISRFRRPVPGSTHRCTKCRRWPSST